VNFRRSVIIAELWPPEVQDICEKVLRCLLEKRFITLKFQNSVPKFFIATPINVVVFKCSKIWPTGNRWIVRYLVDKKQQNFAWRSNCRYCADCAQNVPGQAMYSECSKFHLNRFTFGGVIAERMNTAKLPRRVNPIFGRRLASSRIITLLPKCATTCQRITIF